MSMKIIRRRMKMTSWIAEGSVVRIAVMRTCR